VNVSDANLFIYLLLLFVFTLQLRVGVLLNADLIYKTLVINLFNRLTNIIVNNLAVSNYCINILKPDKIKIFFFDRIQSVSFFNRYFIREIRCLLSIRANEASELAQCN